MSLQWALSVCDRYFFNSEMRIGEMGHHDLVFYYDTDCTTQENFDQRHINRSVELFPKSSTVGHASYSYVSVKRGTIRNRAEVNKSGKIFSCVTEMANSNR